MAQHQDTNVDPLLEDKQRILVLIEGKAQGCIFRGTAIRFYPPNVIERIASKENITDWVNRSRETERNHPKIKEELINTTFGRGRMMFANIAIGYSTGESTYPHGPMQFLKDMLLRTGGESLNDTHLPLQPNTQLQGDEHLAPDMASFVASQHLVWSPNLCLHMEDFPQLQLPHRSYLPLVYAVRNDALAMRGGARVAYEVRFCDEYTAGLDYVKHVMMEFTEEEWAAIEMRGEAVELRKAGTKGKAAFWCDGFYYLVSEME
tara:strand:- start:25264 stop:26049 length:786 start_codon:yes stop_codon:yes gene_type:complete